LVVVRRDEAGHDDCARAVDDFGVGSGDVLRNLSDGFAVDQHVTSLEVTDFGVETENNAAPQQNAALAAVPN
jgi:hypothetical protein